MKFKDKMSLKDLEWDSELFNLNIGRLDIFKEVNDKELKDFISLHNIWDMIYVFNHQNNTNNNVVMSKVSESKLMDVNIEFSKELEVVCTTQNIKNFIDSNVRINEDVIKIAKESFHYSRFIQDDNFETNLSKQFYSKWVMSAFYSKKYFLLYEEHDSVLGFVLFDINKNSARIELIAVKNTEQGRGIGNKMMCEVEQFILNKGVRKIYVGTQINNILAQNFYIKHGYLYNKVTSIYHVWYRKDSKI